MSVGDEFGVVVGMTARCFGFLIALPLGEGLGVLPRLLMSVGLSLFFFDGGRAPSSIGVGLYAIEFLLGFLLAAPVRAVVDIAEMVGELIDTARGQTIAAVNDPLNGIGASDLAVVAKTGATIVVLLCGAGEALLLNLRASFLSLPLGTLAFTDEYIGHVGRSLASSVAVGLTVAAVWMGAFLLIDIACGVANRLLQSLSFIQVAAALKVVITFFILYQALVFGAEDAGSAIRALAMSASVQGALSPSAAPTAAPAGMAR